ncbi:hypothetical protein E2P81_ATG11662 [Venturia nashicola]|uniref:20S-pre-rRNA D-site endonuclease NOB1 n=1 Tax=Venturia nashicola TaxID=86259 RepID=A0A4Z1NXW6_9PEZI|nr:hypothetical protein E6O75_ATG11355 [Venturia nashicola]TLD18752.1 hypothetical protein E2P81_ATG11662 [Venturia nashicola]
MSATPSNIASDKPIHTVVLDAAPIIRGEPGISSLLLQCEEIVSTPEVIREIRDEATRSRLQTTLMPFLTLRSPTQNSVKVITDFARKTGDLAVLSKVDIHLLALSYEIECEKNGGDWRLRSVPGQKRTNGPPPAKIEADAAAAAKNEATETAEQERTQTAEQESTQAADSTTEVVIADGGPVGAVEESACTDRPVEIGFKTTERLPAEASQVAEDIPSSVNPVPETATTAITATVVPERSPTTRETPSDPVTTVLESPPSAESQAPKTEESSQDTASTPDLATTSIEQLSQQLGSTPLADTAPSDSDSDDGWITPSNLKKKQQEDTRNINSTNTTPAKMQVATITGDYAMQNVLLQMNLNLLSPTLDRIRNIRTFVLRCHACFNIVKETSKQFCPRCGKDTLTRVSCTTDANGEFKLHLKKNMQWNHRGDRFSIPKPVAGASNGKVVGGGKNGWGNGLIFAEDQKEFVRGNEEGKRLKQRDLMDEDYLPGILTGDRRAGTGRMKVGAGRNVNSKKR